MHRLRRLGIVSLVLLVALSISFPLSTASAFASPLFQAQWQAGEANGPNFWGPLGLAREGQQEPYADAPGKQRLVQYFDKARMELNDPAKGIVTNGLLARELILGTAQLGDTAGEKRAPAAIPVAGDLDNPGPTYAAINANGATLMKPDTASTEGDPTTIFLSPTGVLGTYSGVYLNDPYAGGSHPDTTTHHNIPKAFCDFRARVGIASIGLAIAEPFWSKVKVGGQQKEVLIQAFERRVLTYTPTNPDPYKVEFGNIGQHYYTWRYQTPATGAMLPAPTSAVTGTVTDREKIALLPNMVVLERIG